MGGAGRAIDGSLPRRNSASSRCRLARGGSRRPGCGRTRGSRPCRRIAP